MFAGVVKLELDLLQVQLLTFVRVYHRGQQYKFRPWFADFQNEFLRKTSTHVQGVVTSSFSHKIIIIIIIKTFVIFMIFSHLFHYERIGGMGLVRKICDLWSMFSILHSWACGNDDLDVYL